MTIDKLCFFVSFQILCVLAFPYGEGGTAKAVTEEVKTSPVSYSADTLPKGEGFFVYKSHFYKKYEEF